MKPFVASARAVAPELPAAIAMTLFLATAILWLGSLA